VGVSTEHLPNRGVILAQYQDKWGWSLLDSTATEQRVVVGPTFELKVIVPKMEGVEFSFELSSKQGNLSYNNDEHTEDDVTFQNVMPGDYSLEISAHAAHDTVDIVDVSIRDRNLRYVVRQAEPGEFVSFAGEQWPLDTAWLDASHESVSDLSPLVHLVELQHLDLQYTQVSDLAPLAGLTKLVSLNLEETKVADLSPLAQLVDLETLRVSTTAEHIAGMGSLVMANVVTDLSPLTKLTKLRVIHMGENTQVSDLRPLGGLPLLESVTIGSLDLFSVHGGLSEEQAEDVAPLPQIDVAPLSAVTSLIELEVDEVVSSLDSIAKLTNLKRLRIATDECLATLSCLSKLEELNISEAATDVATFHSKLSDEELVRWDTLLESGKSTSEAQVSIRPFSLTSITALKALRKLCITSFRPGLDLSQLSQSKGLEELTVAGHLTCLSSLKHLSGLQRLILYVPGLTEPMLERLRKALPSVNVSTISGDPL